MSDLEQQAAAEQKAADEAAAEKRAANRAAAEAATREDLQPTRRVVNGPMPAVEKIEGGRVVGADEAGAGPGAAERAGMSARDKAMADPTRSVGEKNAQPVQRLRRLGNPPHMGVIRAPEQNPPINDPDNPAYDAMTDEEREQVETASSVTAFQQERLDEATKS